MKEIYIATHNNHKVLAFKQILEPLGYHVKSLNDLDIIENIAETGSTFAENALIKARFLYYKIHALVIADDSGLCIDFYNGAPGLYSARFLAGKTYQEKNEHILDEMQYASNRDAYFISAIACIDDNGKEHVFEARVDGKIATSMQGEGGFGYDAIFYDPKAQKTYAMMSVDEKNKVCARGLATQKCIEYLKEKK